MKQGAARITGVLVALGGLLASPPAHALTGAEMVDRAMDWVEAELLYCVSPNNAYDSTCGYTCNRDDNPLWDPYRSDCSGLVSWAWGLPPPGLSTAGFAPYGGSASFKISPLDLQPGDALNDRDQYGDKFHHHIMLFAGWVAPNKARIIQESGCGKVANESFQLVEIVGDRVKVGKYLYHAIRSKNVSQSCESFCEGSKIHGADCGVGDCAAYGATCTKDELGVRCVYTQCPPQGTVGACLDQDRITTCKDGLPTDIGDCSAYAAHCSLAGGTAHCASYFCAAPGEKPVAHDGCFLDGSIMHCDDTGVVSKLDPCPAGTKCSVHPSPHCEPSNGCPPEGDVRLCINGVAARCYNGTLGEAVDCAAQGRECVVVDGFAGCSEETSGDGTDPGSAGSPQGGQAGQAGGPGQGGEAGISGASGQGGAAGSSGASGQGGDGGTSGASGQSGAPGTAGGAGQGGKAGKGGGGGDAGGGQVVLGGDSTEEGGCAVPRAPRNRDGGALAALAALAALVIRRRRAGG